MERKTKLWRWRMNLRESWERIGRIFEPERQRLSALDNLWPWQTDGQRLALLELLTEPKTQSCWLKYKTIQARFCQSSKCFLWLLEAFWTILIKPTTFMIQNFEHVEFWSSSGQGPRKVKVLVMSQTYKDLNLNIRYWVHVTKSY